MWVQVVFWVLVIPLLILLMILYARGKKLYRVMYILSAFTYSMLIMYLIDAYDLNRDWILGLLALSTIIMMFAGYHFHKKPAMNTLAKRTK